MILVCYDGSDDAQSAVDRAGELLGGEEATVLTVWEGFAEVLARTGGGFGAAAMNFEQIDAESEQSAQTRAQGGVDRAQAGDHVVTRPGRIAADVALLAALQE